MQVLGIQMTLFAAIIGGVTVASGTGFIGHHAELCRGILILLLKPLPIGDNIITQGQEGNGIFYTDLLHGDSLSFDNKIVIVPNSKIVE